MRAEIAPEREIAAALQAYGMEPDSVAYLTSGSYCAAYRVSCGGKEYVARLRSPWATRADVLFAARWARAVSSEVPVTAPLMPVSAVPVVGGRCLDIAPYIPHEHTDGGKVDPEAWELVGQWLGTMHRLGAPLRNAAPCELRYGNHPNRSILAACLEHAEKTVPQSHVDLLARASTLLRRAERGVYERADPLPVGVVHGDMHFWNVMYSNGMPVAIMDLDFLQKGILLFDLAYASIWLEAWERDRGAPWKDVTERYLAAYGRGREAPLSDAEVACLPWCRSLVHIMFFLYSIHFGWQGVEKGREDLTEADRVMSQVEGK